MVVCLFCFLATPCGMWDLNFLTMDWTCDPPALEAQNLNHWTIKEIPSLVIIIKFQTEQSLERNTSTTGQPGATLNFRDFPMLSKDVKKIIVWNLNSWPHDSFLGRGRRELSPWGKATEELMLQAPGLQGRENLPGWRLEEEFLVSAPARRGE